MAASDLESTELVDDVDWASPMSLALAPAIMLAALVTLPSYVFLPFTGHQIAHPD
jgi:hypothetical protein